MLKFKCIYCGQKIGGGEKYKGKKIKCPKCGHEILVNDAVLISGDEHEPSEAEIEMMLEKAKHGGMDEKDRNKDFVQRWLRKWFAPRFDELSVFLMVVAAVLVGGTSDEVKGMVEEHVEIFFRATPSSNAMIFFGVIILGVCLVGALPVFHVFSKREKHEWERWVMLGLAVWFTAGSGIIAGEFMLEEARKVVGVSGEIGAFFPRLEEIKVLKWKAIFPMWNIINGMSVSLMFKTGVITTECFNDRDAKLVEVLLGLVVLVVVFAICQYILKQHWAVTYSICIVYSTNFFKWGDEKRA